MVIMPLWNMAGYHSFLISRPAYTPFRLGMQLMAGSMTYPSKKILFGILTDIDHG